MRKLVAAEVTRRIHSANSIHPPASSRQRLRSFQTRSLAVGTPVARRPPHKSRRAVSPHSVLGGWLSLSIQSFRSEPCHVCCMPSLRDFHPQSRRPLLGAPILILRSAVCAKHQPQRVPTWNGSVL